METEHGGKHRRVQPAAERRPDQARVLLVASVAAVVVVALAVVLVVVLW